MGKTFWQVVAILLLLGLIFGGGYYLGYKSVSVTERVVEKLVPGDTIRDSIRFPVPVYVDRWHPGKVDTVYFPAPTSPIDSASVVEDYFATRDYLWISVRILVVLSRFPVRLHGISLWMLRL